MPHVIMSGGLVQFRYISNLRFLKIYRNAITYWLGHIWGRLSWLFVGDNQSRGGLSKKSGKCY